MSWESADRALSWASVRSPSLNQGKLLCNLCDESAVGVGGGTVGSAGAGTLVGEGGVGVGTKGVGVGSGVADGVGSGAAVGLAAAGGAALGVGVGLLARVSVGVGAEVGAGVEVGATVDAGDGATVGVEVAAGTTGGAERKARLGVGEGCAQPTLSQANIARRLGTKDARKPVSSLPFLNHVQLDPGDSPEAFPNRYWSARYSIPAARPKPAGAVLPAWQAKERPSGRRCPTHGIKSRRRAQGRHHPEDRRTGCGFIG
jgi:hypothetical protein